MERARNTDRLRWAGDPERWGGQTVLEAVSAAAPLIGAADGQQILRAQTRDLIAIAWDLFATFEFTEGLTADDTGELAIALDIGTGQASSRVFWHLATIERGQVRAATPTAAALGWSSGPEIDQLPYTAFASIPAGSAGPVALAPGVPPGYRLHATNISVAPILNAGTRVGALYLSDSTQAIVGAAIGLTSDAFITAAPLDWYAPPSDTPTVQCFPGFPGLGEQIDVAVLGHLEKVGATGVAVSKDPIVACSINARPTLRVAHGGGADHRVRCRVIAHCSPRSWVP